MRKYCPGCKVEFETSLTKKIVNGAVRKIFTCQYCRNDWHERSIEIIKQKQKECTSNQRPIFLSGPMKYNDDHRTWRERIQKKIPHQPFIEPFGEFPNALHRSYDLVHYDIEIARACPIIVHPFGAEAPDTVGTHYEIATALESGNRVAIVPEGKIDCSWVRERDIGVYYNFFQAIAYLNGYIDPRDVSEQKYMMEGQK